MKPKLCTHCRKRSTNFHSKTAPFCIECNTIAGRRAKYKREAQKDPRAFVRKLKDKETQLADMVKALSEVRV